MAVMFGLDGAGFEGPGAAAVVANPMFQTIKALYASDVTTQTGSYTTYRVGGSLISSVGTHTGNVVDMVNLDEGSATAFFSALVGIVGFASGGVGNVLLGALGLTGSNIASKHLLDGSERIMYVWAGLTNAIGAGDLNVGTEPMSSVTGQAWTGAGNEPRVVVFRKASGDVAAYVQKEGSGWTLSTIDQQTSITLTPAAPDSGEPPKCVVNQVGKDPYSCVLQQDANTVTREIDVNLNNTIDQTTTTTQVTDTAQEVKVEDGAGKVLTDTMTDGASTYDLTKVADRVEVEHDLSPAVKTNDVSPTFWQNFTQDTSDMIVVNVSVAPVYVPPTHWAEPWVPFDMGAFYESVSTKNDLAKSIASSTPVVLDANQHGISAAQLAARDSNADGQLSGTELSNLSLWKDLNENGFIDAGELTAVASAVSAMSARDYGFEATRATTP